MPLGSKNIFFINFILYLFDSSGPGEEVFGTAADPHHAIQTSVIGVSELCEDRQCESLLNACLVRLAAHCPVLSAEKKNHPARFPISPADLQWDHKNQSVISQNITPTWMGCFQVPTSSRR